MERFRIRNDQLAALRRLSFADGLTELLRDEGWKAARDPASGDVLAQDAQGRQTRYGLDANGYLGGVVLPSGRTWRMDNDPHGRAQAVTTPSGLRLGFDRNEAGDVTQVTRDGETTLRLEYGDQGKSVRYLFQDDTEARIDYAGPDRPAVITDRLGHQDKLLYTARGKLRAVEDSGGNRTSFRYRRAAERPYFMRHPDGGVELYEYDGDGQLRGISDGGGPLLRIERDEQNRPVEVAYRDGGSCRFQYDDAGNLRAASGGGSSAGYGYDERGRVTAEDHDGHVVRYEYDDNGRLSAMTYPSGGRVAFDYDGDGRVQQLTDWNGGITRVRYDAEDRGELWEYPNGVSSAVTFNKAGLPLTTVVRHGLSEIFSLRYDYDGQDRIRWSSDSEFGTRQYGYDAEGQVLRVSASLAARNETFAYDHGGNRIQWNRQTSEVDAANKLRTQGSLRQSYDQRGNLTGRLSKNRERWFFYNAQDLLVKTDDSYGGSVEFGYDAFRRRIWKRSEKAEVRYLWAGEQLIGEEITEVATGKREIREYLYLPGTWTPVALRIDGAVFYYHTDRQGTPRRITGDRGEVVWAADYLAFGQAVVHERKIANPLRLPGQYLDEETGFHYNRFRYYCPGTGRYITRDPIGFLAGFNLYTYAGNDPINAADPSGLWSWKSVAKVALPIMAAVAVGAAVVAFAPVALPAAIILGGAAAGIAGSLTSDGLATALDGTKFCVKCALLRAAAAGIGGAAGAAIGLAAAPLIPWAGAAAGAVGRVGTASLVGAAASTGDYLTRAGLDPYQSITAAGATTAAALGILSGGLFERFGPKTPAKPGRPFSRGVRLTEAELRYRGLVVTSDLPENIADEIGQNLADDAGERRGKKQRKQP